MSHTMPPPRSVVAPLAALGGLIAWAYWPTLAWMFDKWVGDPQYSHGFLVPAFSGYLLYLNRDRFTDFCPAPLLGGLVLVAAFAMRAVAGGLLFHQLDAVSLLVALAGTALAVGGPRVLRPAAPAIAFLVFMIPLPYEMERNVGGPLKSAATTASTFLLQTCGLPAVAEGNVILIDEVRLGVVDACSGLKMLMTFAAFSAGAVILARRTAFERLMVLLGIVPIAMLSNVLRITATGVSHTFTHEKAAVNFLHDLYGWFMMPVGLALLGLELWVLGRLVVQPNK
jgi:exosortase